MIFRYLLAALLLAPIAFAAAPTIDSVLINQTTYMPIENSTVTVKVMFNVTDTDGIANLNNSACTCEFDNNATWYGLYESASDTSCDNTTIDADTVEYTCLVNMQFWYENNTYTVNVSVKDNATTVTNATETFTHAVLVASALDTTTIAFGTLTTADFGTNKTDTNNPLIVTNTGNQLLSLKITGAELEDSTGISPNISVTKFYTKNGSSPSGAMELTRTQQSIPNTSVPLEDATLGGNTEEVWWFFNVPNPLRPGSYSGIWTLVEE